MTDGIDTSRADLDPEAHADKFDPSTGAYLVAWEKYAALLSERDALQAKVEALEGPRLARHQPCGCIICSCNDDERCHGCGAKHCGTHPIEAIPNPTYDGPHPQFAAGSEKPKKYWAVYSASGMHIGLWDDEGTARSVLDEQPGQTILELVEARPAPTVEQAARVLWEAFVSDESEANFKPAWNAWKHRIWACDGSIYSAMSAWLKTIAGGKDHE